MVAHRSREVSRIRLDDIEMDDGPRPINDDAVARLAKSMGDIGMHAPVVVTFERFAPDDRGRNDRRIFKVVSGRHRIAAARSLGWSEIEAIRFDESPSIESLPDDANVGVLAEMWAIAENLHRAELTALERDQQIARWVELSAIKLAQHAPVCGGRGNEGGLRAASRDLRIERRDAQRAVKVASLSEEAKEAARDVGLDDNRTALLKAAREETPEAQVVSLRQHAVSTIKPAADPLNDFEAREKQVARLMSAWNAASPEAREEFFSRVDRPIMDGRYRPSQEEDIPSFLRRRS